LLQRLGNWGEIEEAGDEGYLAGDAALSKPSNLAFADHVYQFKALNRPRRRVEGAESLTGSTRRLMDR
jgi:hypothetical protein